MEKSSIKEEDLIFKSEILNILGQRFLSYILAIISFIFPDIMKSGMLQAIRSINYLLIIGAIISLLVLEVILRFLIYEYQRYRNNNDNRNKMLALPEGVYVDDILPFIVKNYYIKFHFYWNNDKTALNIQRIETGDVIPGTCNVSDLRYDVLAPFKKEYSDTELRNKAGIDFKLDLRSDIQVAHERWITNDFGMSLYQVNFTEEISKESDNKVTYSLVTTINDYIQKEKIITESYNELLENIVLEIKDVTICIDFPDDIILRDKEFIAIGKSKVILNRLIKAILNQKENKKINKISNRNLLIIKIKSPAPDVRYGFKWNWGGIVE